VELDPLDLYFENTTPPHRKFYRLTLEPSLFYVRLRRQWGRIGTQGRQKEDFYDTWPEAYRAFRSLTRRRLRHGYRTCNPPRQVVILVHSWNGPQSL